VIAVDSWRWPAVLISLFTIAVLLVGRRLHQLFPGVLVVVVVGAVLSEVLGYDGAVVGEVPSGLPPLSLSFRFTDFWRLVVPGAVIALLGFAEVAAISRTFATQDRERWDPSREFVSQGIANAVAAVSGGFPVGGSFSRSSVARVAGGRTRWAGAVTGAAVLAFLPFAGVISGLPRAVLAAIVIVAVIRLVRLMTMVRLITKTWGQAFVAWVTFAATLALSPRIELGVIVGVAAAAAVHLRRETLIRVTARQEDGVLVLQPSGVLFYGSTARLDETFSTELAAHPEIRSVVVDLNRLGRIDYTGALALKEFLDDAAAAGLEVAVRDIPPHAEGTLNRSWGDDLTHLHWEG
jgi:SulP family sulfate permease